MICVFCFCIFVKSILLIRAYLSFSYNHLFFMPKKNKNIIFATSNQNKVNEVSKQLTSLNISITSLLDLNFKEEIPETADTFRGNALLKAKFIHNLYHEDVFAEDTGLEVFCLNMEPGVHTARYAGPQRNNNDNMNLLLNNLKDIDDRSAQFRTVISLIFNNEEFFFEGKVQGKIDFVKSGNMGFGYDPIFIPKGFDKSFSHFTKKEKNEISHRGIAVKKLIHFLNSH